MRKYQSRDYCRPTVRPDGEAFVKIEAVGRTTLTSEHDLDQQHVSHIEDEADVSRLPRHLVHDWQVGSPDRGRLAAGRQARRVRSRTPRRSRPRPPRAARPRRRTRGRR